MASLTDVLLPLKGKTGSMQEEFFERPCVTGMHWLPD